MKRGDVVLAEVYFTDLSGVKIRPVVVVSSYAVNRGDDRVVIPVSSNVAKPSRWGVLARDSDAAFKQTGLRRASVFRCDKVLTLSKALIRRKLGTADLYLVKIAKCLGDALGL